MGLDIQWTSAIIGHLIFEGVAFDGCWRSVGVGPQWESDLNGCRSPVGVGPQWVSALVGRLLLAGVGTQLAPPKYFSVLLFCYQCNLCSFVVLYKT